MGKLKRYVSSLMLIVILSLSSQPAWAALSQKWEKVSEIEGVTWSKEVPGRVEWDFEGDYWSLVLEVGLVKNGTEIVTLQIKNPYTSEVDLQAYIDSSGTYTYVIRRSTASDRGMPIRYEEYNGNDTYIYQKPEVQMGISEDLSWDDDQLLTASWKPVEDTDDYLISLYSKKGNNGKWFLETEDIYGHQEIDYAYLYADFNRQYCFTVKALSNDIEAVANGETSKKSIVFDINDRIKPISDHLDTLLATSSDAREDLNSSFSREELEAAMQYSADFRLKIQKLEKKYANRYSVSSEVIVLDDIVDSAQVSVIGSGLCYDETATGTDSNAKPNKVVVSFKEAEAWGDFTIESADKFETGIEINVEINDQELDWLSFPLAIKYPVPENLDPDKVIILDCAVNMDKRIYPQIVREDGQSYMWFAISGAGHYTILERWDEIDLDLEDEIPKASSSGGSGSRSYSTASQYQWKQNETGWWLEDRYGVYPTNSWIDKDGRWYWFDSVGYMVTGWYLVDEWWYFFDTNGTMLINQKTPDGYQVDGSGKWIQ